MSNLTFLNEGDKIEAKGSAKLPYEIKKAGGVVSCTCQSWKTMGGGIDWRVCKHIRLLVDPACLLPIAQAQITGPSGKIKPIAKPVRLTKTGKISKAVGGAVKKDTAPPFLLAHSWEDEDPTGWWMSEKLDGVRALWDYKTRTFTSRLGNEFHAPDWFKDAIQDNVGDMMLDGELWVGRKKFHETISIVRKHIPQDNEWKNVTFMVFDGGWMDLEDMKTDTMLFEDRMEHLRYEIEEHGGDGNNKYLKFVKQTKCEGEAHLRACLKEAEALGAEGLMIRKPGSKYENDKSSTCLKVKSFYDDEAIVTGYTDGRGKHKGRVGAIIANWNGMKIEIGGGLKDEDRKNPPKIGAKITFRYTEKTNAGMPRFSRYLCERNYE